MTEICSSSVFVLAPVNTLSNVNHFRRGYQDFKVTRTHGVELYSAVGYSLIVGCYPRINVVKEHENSGHFGIRFKI